MTPDRDRRRISAALGFTQTMSWASTIYLPAILADPIAATLHCPTSWVFGAFTAAFLLMGVLTPLVGRQIDRRGGRAVLAASNIVIAAGLVLLGLAQSVGPMALGWLVIGAGMAMGLYDAAFAALAGIFGREARRPITTITLMAGFASTIGWPLSSMLNAAYGWQVTCFVWAAIQLLLSLPINWLLLPASVVRNQPAPAAAPAEPAPAADKQTRRKMWILAFVFSAAWFVTGAMSTHLPRLLLDAGTSPASAIAFAALVGPAQVAARLAEYSLFRNLHPFYSSLAAVSLHPVGGVILAFCGAPFAALFALCHGAGNGLLTIARGTLPLALFGSAGYGTRNGLIGAPARLTQALSPFLFSLVLDISTLAAIILTSCLMLSALLALLLLPNPTVSLD